jgi:hypothetical protein
MTNKPLGDEHSPAFGHGDYVNGGCPGLTKREYIVIAMAQSLISAPFVEGCMGWESDTEIAKRSCEIADALIAAMKPRAQEGER